MILVVDANMLAADTSDDFLGPAGFEIKNAYDGNAAVAAVASSMPDEVLIDIGMPALDGYVAGRLNCGMPNSDSAVLIAQTSCIQSAGIRQATGAGQLTIPSNLSI